MVQRFSDGDAPPPVEQPAADRRVFELVADYEYAAPGGRRWMTIEDVPEGGLAPEATADRVLYEQIVPTKGWLTEEGPTDQGQFPAGRFVLSVTMDVLEAGLAEFHGWYDEEHLPALLAVPEITAARRFRAIGGDLPANGRQRFLALYEMSNDEFLTTEAWATAAANTPRTERVMVHADWASQFYRVSDGGPE